MTFEEAFNKWSSETHLCKYMAPFECRLNKEYNFCYSDKCKDYCPVTDELILKITFINEYETRAGTSARYQITEDYSKLRKELFKEYKEYMKSKK